MKKSKRIIATGLALALVMTSLPVTSVAAESDEDSSLVCQDDSFFYINPTGDEDGDGLLNEQEIDYHTSQYAADSDGDGLSDCNELLVYATDPINPDSDSDGVDDGVEIQMLTAPLNSVDKPSGEYTFVRSTDEDGNFYPGFELTIRGTGRASRSWIMDTKNEAFASVSGVKSPLYMLTPEHGTTSVQMTVQSDVFGQNDSVLYFTENDSVICSFSNTVINEKTICATLNCVDLTGQKVYCFVGDKTLIGKNAVADNVSVAWIGTEQPADIPAWELASDNLAEMEATGVAVNLINCTAITGAIAVNEIGANDESSISEEMSGTATLGNGEGAIIGIEGSACEEVAVLQIAASQINNDVLLKPIILVVTEYDVTNHGFFIDSLEEYIHNGFYITVLDLNDCLNDNQINEMVATGAVVSTNAKYAIGEVSQSVAQIDAGVPTTYSTIESGDTYFDVATHGFSFKNGESYAYSANGAGVCASMALLSLLNYYGLVPAKMKMGASLRDSLTAWTNAAESAKRRMAPVLALEDGEVLYDITQKPASMAGFAGGNTAGFSISREIADEVGKMLSSWWLVSIYLQNQNSFISTTINGAGGGTGYISNTHVATIKSLIDKKQPVYIAAGGNSGSHAVVVVGYEQNGNVLTLKIYDNNYPENYSKTVALTKVNTKWYFEWDDYGYDNNEDNTYYFAYINTSELLNRLNDRPRVTVKYNSPTSYTISNDVINSTNDLVIVQNGTAELATTSSTFTVDSTEAFYYSVATEFIDTTLNNNLLMPDLTYSTRYYGEMPNYVDVSTTQWYYPYVRVAALSGIMGSTGSSYFYPNNTVTAQEYITALLKALNVSMASTATWPDDYLAVAEANGWLSGLPTEFSASEAITRADSAVILWNALTSDIASGHRKEYDAFAQTPAFTDLSELTTGDYSYAYEAVEQTCNVGLFTASGAFDPDGIMTRSSACVTLLKAIGYTF